MGGRHLETYTVMGWTAVAVGSAVHLGLGSGQLRDPGLAVATIITGMVSALTLSLAVALWAGRPLLVFVHTAAAVLIGVGAVPVAMGRPAAPWLAVASCGLLAIVAIGRVGCHHAGCCVGRRGRWGVHYDPGRLPTELLAAHGEGPYIPVQLIEAASSAVLAAAVGTLVLVRVEPSTVIATAAGGYGLIRLMTERLRAPETRPRAAGIVHAVYTAFGLTMLGAVLTWPSGWSLTMMVLGHAGLLLHVHQALRAPATPGRSR